MRLLFFLCWFSHRKGAACEKLPVLKNVWYNLIVLCTWFNSFSIQLETHQVFENIHLWKRTESGAMKQWSAGDGLTKTTSSRAIFLKRRAPEPELCQFYDGSAALVTRPWAPTPRGNFVFLSLEKKAKSVSLQPLICPEIAFLQPLIWKSASLLGLWLTRHGEERRDHGRNPKNSVFFSKKERKYWFLGLEIKESWIGPRDQTYDFVREPN